MKKLKQKLAENQGLTGTFVSFGNSTITEMIGKAGFDFVIIDMEHGAGNEQDLLHQLQALESSPTAAVVRVESFNKERVHRVLDMGAEGIMFPRLRTLDEVKQAIATLYYPPDGVRGVAKMVRASNYGQQFNQYYELQKKQITGIVQVETTEILECLDRVAEVDGVDVLFVGPMDLSMALGVFGQFDHPLFVKAIKDTASAAKKAGKVCGILLPDIRILTEWYEMGYHFFTGGGDMAFINTAATSMAKNMKDKLLPGQ